jgi:hypothetical protein
MNNDKELITRINSLKIKMETAWAERGETDHEVLGLSIEIDKLLNQYYRVKLDSKKKKEKFYI